MADGRLFLGTVESRAVMIADPGCVPFTEYTVRYKNGGDERCDVFTKNALRLIEKTKSIKAVVVFKRPTLWLAATMKGDVATLSEGTSIRPKVARPKGERYGPRFRVSTTRALSARSRQACRLHLALMREVIPGL